jgi:RimJ/RimL family protein N-acetyltransferase
MALPEIQHLTTERFTLRPLQESDCAALFATLSDPQQCLYLTRPAFADEAELWGWLADPDWPGKTWIAQAKGSDEVAARFVAVPAHEEGVTEIGYITVAGQQGRGVASECTSALIEHLFKDGSTRKLTAEVDCENAASVKLLEKLGFVQEAHLRQHETTHIGLRDVYWYGLLRDDWTHR